MGVLKSSDSGITWAPDTDDTALSCAGGALAITIPAKYSGTLEIQVCANYDGSNQFNWEKFVSFSSDLSEVQVAISGNIEARADMYGSSVSEDSSTNALPSFFQSIAGNYSAFAVFHVDVKIATHGIDNRLVIGFNNPHSGDGTVTVKQTYCSISEYNTFQRDHAGALAPQLVSSAGAVTLPS
jgi:hypothetical protein